MTQVVTSKNEIVVPRSVRRRSGIKTGDTVRFTVSGRVISIVPSDDNYTSAERTAINRGIAQSMKEYREGKAAGPFETAEALVVDLHAGVAKLDVPKAKRSKK